MTYATETLKKNLTPRVYLEIAGVGPILTQGLSSLPSALKGSHTVADVIPLDGAAPGALDIDLDRMRQTGASLTVDVIDRSSLVADQFQVRTERATWLAENISASDTSFDVEDGGGLPATPFVMFVDAETMYVTGKSTNTLTVTRAYLGSRAQKHYGGSLKGAECFIAAHAWKGRRATLRQVYVDRDGAVVGTTAGTIGTFRFTEDPTHVEGRRWKLSLTEMTEVYATARCYVGQREVRGRANPADRFQSSLAAVELDAPDAALFVVGGVATHVLMKFNEEGASPILPALVTAGASSITTGFDSGPIVESDAFPSSGDRELASIQHVGVLVGHPIVIALQLILSKLGDGANDATYDVLPGAERDDYGMPDWRFGAGLLAADVDVDAFEALISTPAPCWTLVLDEEFTLGTILDEVARACRAFWYVTSAGLLSIKRLRDRSSQGAQASLTAIDNEVTALRGAKSAKLDRGIIAHSVKLDANWDPFARKFLATVNVNDAELRDQYPEEQKVIALQSKGLSLSVTGFEPTLRGTLRRMNPMSLGDVEVHLRRVQSAARKTRLIYSPQVAHPRSLVNIGDVVVATNSRVPDGAGGTIDAAHFLVIGKDRRPSSPVFEIRLLLLEPGFRIAPVGVLTSWNNGTQRATFSTTDLTAVLTSAPAQDFQEEWPVKVIDVSAAPNTVADANVVAIVSASVLSIDKDAAALTFTPAAGDLIIPAVPAGGESVNTPGFAPQDFLFQMPVDEDTTLPLVTRWG